MKQWAWMSAVVLTSLTTTGCVERRFVVTTEPPGALVMRNGKPVGAAPADDHFIYYGDYDFTLIKDGYETKQVKQAVPAPWYQYPPLDFITETLLPFRIKDVRRFHYQLEPVKAVSPDELMQKATTMRERGKSIQPPPQAPQPQVQQQPPPAFMPGVQQPPASMPGVQQQPVPPQPGPAQTPFFSGFMSGKKKPGV